MDSKVLDFDKMFATEPPEYLDVNWCHPEVKAIAKWKESGSLAILNLLMENIVQP